MNRWIRVIDRAAVALLDVFHWIIGTLRLARNYVRKPWAGADPCGGSAHEAVYVHYDPRGAIHDYVTMQLRELAAAGFRVTFVSNARKFPPGNVPEIAAYCRQIIWRRNVGY